ncbi:hypothetical protein K2P97_09085 [bacterium]|nr:hypothetical protein [bacterium]
MRYLLLSLFLVGCSSGGGHSTNNKIDLNRLRGDAKKALVPYEDTPDDIRYKNTDSQQTNYLPYGIGKSEVACVQKDQSGNIIGIFIGVDLSYCKKFSYLYWLKLQWSCESEKDHFVKNKTLNFLARKPEISVFNSEEQSLETPFFLLTNTNFESYHKIKASTFDSLNHLSIRIGNNVFRVSREALHRTIIIPDFICSNTESKNE